MAINHKRILANSLAARFGRRRLLQGAGAAAVGLPATAHATGGGHIKIAWIDFVDTLDPHFTSYLGAIKIHNNIYNGLLKVVYDGEKVSFVPDLAESWTLLDDKTHVFKLHSGVKFHDGEICDAEAVKWSVERVWKGKPKSPHAWKYDYLESVEVVDPLTVKLTFKNPYAFLPVALTGSTGRAGTIVPRKAVEKFGADYGRNPVGTGPFKFVSWKENDSIVLEKNPDYWEKGLPKLDKATFLIMKEASSAVAAMLAGRVDGMSNSPLQFINQLKANPTLTVYGEIEGNYSLMAMNCRRAPLDDVNVRRAIGFAIDRETLIKQAFFGIGIPAYTPISPPMTGFYDKDIAKSGRGQFFDLEKAKSYRAKAKIQDPIEVVILTSEQGQYGTRVAQTIVPMLDKVGIKAKLELIERAAWVRRRNSGEFDMLDMTWSADLDPDETIFPEWHSGKPWNFSGWANPEFDKLVSQAQVILDVKKRSELYVKAEDILMDEAPMAILTHMPEFKILSKKVKGFKYTPVDSLDLHTVSL